MLFNSFAYFVFLAVVIVAIRLLGRMQRAQQTFLLVASNFFYGYWDYRFLALLWVSIVVDFSVGLALSKPGASEKRRKMLVAASVVVNLTILGFFKYFSFFQAGFESLLTSFGIPFQPLVLEIALPVGISFYTFQSLSYSIDVYRGKAEPCRDLLIFAQFVCYFPQLVAGPIERASRLIPQLQRTLHITGDKLASGGLLIVWGLFKKVVAADLAGVYLVDQVFGNPGGGLHLWIASTAFGFQIYLDFSGYCDIARGTSRCFGVDLVENFHAPYVARNITDFWRRWHISLSSWYRDYLYIPLGGNRGGTWATYRNLAITMFLCGLWHGASMAFVIWGIYHGVLLMGHRAFGLRRNYDARDKPPSTVVRFGAWALCFAAVVFGWMLFRVDSMDLVRNARMMLTPAGLASGDLALAGRLALSTLVFALPVAAAHWVQIRAFKGTEIENLFRSPYLVGAIGGTLLLLVFLLGSLRENLPFIYFQF